MLKFDLDMYDPFQSEFCNPGFEGIGYQSCHSLPSYLYWSQKKKHWHQGTEPCIEVWGLAATPGSLSIIPTRELEGGHTLLGSSSLKPIATPIEQTFTPLVYNSASNSTIIPPKMSWGLTSTGAAFLVFEWLGKENPSMTLLKQANALAFICTGIHGVTYAHTGMPEMLWCRWCKMWITGINTSLRGPYLIASMINLENHCFTMIGGLSTFSMYYPFPSFLRWAFTSLSKKHRQLVL